MVIVPPQPQARGSARQQAQIAKPLDLYVCPFTVLESNAEQLPWTFQGIVMGGRQLIVKRKRQYMKTADYSIEGFENRILIERKANDFVSSITAEAERFRREHERMHEIIKTGGFCCIICEGNMAAICDELDDPCSGRKVTSDSVVGWLASWPRRYGVPVFFAGDRRRAELLAFGMLWKWWDEVGRLLKTDGQATL
jgi:hypothetical protein